MTVAEMVKAEERLAIEFGDYEDQWVAIRDRHVVAHASSFKDLRQEVRESNLKIDSITFVLPDGDTACFF